MAADSRPSRSEREPKPIIDPDGEWLWVPAAIAADQDAAVAYARDYWPGKLCYEPLPIERWRLVPYDEADEEGRATCDEFGSESVAEPDVNGDAYWPIRCYPEVLAS